MPLRREVADERAHVAHAGGVESGGGLVEQQQAWLADQRAGDAEPLPHAVGVASHAILGAPRQVDGVERGVDASSRAVAVEGRDELEVLAAREVRVEARSLHESGHAFERPHAVDHRIATEEACAAAGRPDQPEQHAQRRRLAGAVGSEVAVHVAAFDGQVDVVDGRDVAVGLEEAASLDDRAHASTARRAASAALGGSEPTSV